MAITLDDLTQYLDDQEWHYTMHEEENYISMRMNMKAVDSCACILSIRGEGKTLLVYTIFPIKIPEECRAAEAEYLSRANYGLWLGNFELDFEDGEIRYKSMLAVEPDEAPSEAVLDRVVNVGFSMVDQYAPGILSVLYANDEPAHAIARIENKDDD